MENPSRTMRWYLIKPVIIGLLILVIYGVVSSRVTAFEIASLKAWDFFAKIKYKIKPIPGEVKDIVIISIDSRAYDWFNKKWPWPRIVHANLIYKLTEYEPKIIALNLAFIGKSQREGEDDLLAQAFKDAGNVYIASYFDKEGYPHPPYEKFADVVKGFGSTNKPHDKDSVIRYTQLFDVSVGNIILSYSFEFKIACDYFGIPLGIPAVGGRGGRVPEKDDSIVILNYEALLSDFTVVPILDVLQGKISPGILKDKIVLVDMTGEGFGAVYDTPLGPMPGGGIIANNIVMLLCHSFVKEIPKGISLLILVLFAVTIGVLTSRMSLLKGFIYLLLLMLLFFLISIAIIILDFTWDFLSVPFAIICIFLVINCQKLIYFTKEALFLKKNVIRDSLTGLPSLGYLQVRLQSDLREAIRGNKNLSLVIFGIDNYDSFKLALRTGEIDMILKQLARLIRKYSRKTRYMDFISRYSEDKFCAVLRAIPAEGAEAYAKRIRYMIGKERFLGKKELALSLRTGIASYPIVRSESAEEFIKYAEADLRRSVVEK